MNSDIDLAEAALAAYSNPATIETARVHAYITQPAGGQIIALRGTNPKDLIDLALDAEMIKLRNDPIFGPCTDVAMTNAEQLIWRLWPLLQDPFDITGHSKAAIEAQALAAILKHMGRAPRRLVVFAPPQLGDLGGYLSDVPGVAYRHGEDPVTDFPVNRGRPQSLLGLPWVGHTPLDKLDYHAMQGYVDAVRLRLN